MDGPDPDLTGRQPHALPAFPTTYSVGQVAAFLCCDPSIVETQLELGDIPGVRFGSEWMIPAQAFVHYVNDLALTQAHERQFARDCLPQARDMADRTISGSGEKPRTPAGPQLISLEELEQLASIILIEPIPQGESAVASPLLRRL